MKRMILLVFSLCLVLLLLPTAAMATRFDQAVDQLVAQGYPQATEDYLCGLGTNPLLGFRWAGTSADNQAATYLAGRLKAAGLRNVRLEPVPVDVFEFTSASVTVGGRTMIASAFAGVPPTPSRGLTREVVYVGAGSAADYEAAPSVAGKLVLVDFTLDYYWWLFCIGAQADLRGAAGIIMTHAPVSGDWFSAAPDALGTMDAMYDFDLPPMVYVSEPDGDWIKTQLVTAAAAGTPLTARLWLKQKVTLADAGGVGYNVVAELPGRVNDGTFVLYCSHHDAHFTGGFDDTSGVAAELAIARAMAQSGYRPQHKVVFLFTTGEEFGYTNARWDWAIGAWWANMRAHPGWAGRARAMINFDMVGSAGTPLVAWANVELSPWLDARSKALSSLLPYGGVYVLGSIPNDVDAWTFSAAGVPAVSLMAPPVSTVMWHTNYDDPAYYPIDWAYVGEIAKFIYRLQVGLDTQLLPYDLKARGDELGAVVVPGELLSAGADAAAVARLQAAVNDFRTAANHFAARRSSITAGDIPAANTALLAIEKEIGAGFTGLTVLGDPAYPHEEVLADVKHLNAADLGPRPVGAQAGRRGGGAPRIQGTFAVDSFNDDVYRQHLRRMVPGYYRLAWGEQAHLAPLLDVIDQYHAAQTASWQSDEELDQLIARLKTMRDADMVELNARLDDMSAVLENVTPLVQGL